jgi:hypothetical protein
MDWEIICKAEIFANPDFSIARSSQASALQGGGTTFFTVI